MKVKRVFPVSYTHLKPYFTDTPYTARDYSLYRIGNRLKKIDNVLENGKYVEQTFSTEKPFNVVAVHFKVNDVNNQESNYKLSLYKDGKCTESVVILSLIHIYVIRTRYLMIHRSRL